MFIWFFQKIFRHLILLNLTCFYKNVEKTIVQNMIDIILVLKGVTGYVW